MSKPEETARTPGPWRVTRGQVSEAREVFVDGPNGEYICSCYTPAAEANAKLIAAAPDLLAALRFYANATDADWANDNGHNAYAVLAAFGGKDNVTTDPTTETEAHQRLPSIPGTAGG